MDLRKRREEDLRKGKRTTFAKRMRTAIIAVILTTVITTIAVDATDNLGNFSDSIVGTAVSGLFSKQETGPCPGGMVFVSSSNGGFCIDSYENSPSSECLFSEPANQNETTTNLENRLCKAVSAGGKMPWRNVALQQAEILCAREGKHLPSNEEWYLASLGTPDSPGNVDRGDCNVKGQGVLEAGSKALCVSSYGAHDMIGNVWEWVAETVVDGTFDTRTLPNEGYVTSVDTKGVPVTTNASSSDPSFYEDYFWVEKNGVRGMIRGGYFGNGTDAGQFTINAITPTSFTGAAVGFRCAK